MTTTAPLASFSPSSLAQILAESTPACEPTKNKVVFQLNTALVIPDFAAHYDPNSLETFQPAYTALGDGSLLASPFGSDLSQAILSLLVLSMLLMLFLQNVVITGHYLLVRSKIIKVRQLFYVLFFSQLLGPLALIPTIVSYFNQRVNCTTVLAIGAAAAFVSLSALVTGILGYKAYKCSNNSRIILALLGLLQIAFAVVSGLEIKALRGDRRLSGSCNQVSRLPMTSASVTVLFSEMAFISLCFLTAVWRSRGSPVARGRISLRLSLELRGSSEPVNSSSPGHRGRWDFVLNGNNQSRSDHDGSFFGRLRSLRDGLITFFNEAPRDFPGSDALQQPSPFPDDEKAPSNMSTAHRSTHSFGRFSRIIPRMELFQKVVKDELYYTTFISIVSMLAVIFSLIGLNSKNGITVQGWMSIEWGLISLVVIHSFGRALSRHEADAAASLSVSKWNGVTSISQFTPTRPSPALSSQQVLEKTLDPANNPNNPFSDARRLTETSVYSVSSYRGDTSSRRSQSPQPLTVPSSRYLVSTSGGSQFKHPTLPGTSEPSPESSPPIEHHFFSVH